MRYAKPIYWQNKLLLVMATAMLLIPASVVLWKETLHPTGARLMDPFTMSILFGSVLLHKATSGLRCGTWDVTLGILMLAYMAIDFITPLYQDYEFIWTLCAIVLFVAAYFTGVGLRAMRAKEKRKKEELEALRSQS